MLIYYDVMTTEVVARRESEQIFRLLRFSAQTEEERDVHLVALDGALRPVHRVMAWWDGKPLSDERRCFECHSVGDLSTGGYMGHGNPGTFFCGACWRTFMEWLHGHTRRRFGKLRFYDHASFPPA